MVGRLEERDMGQEIKDKYNTPMNDLWMDDVQPQYIEYSKRATNDRRGGILPGPSVTRPVSRSASSSPCSLYERETKVRREATISATCISRLVLGCKDQQSPEKGKIAEM